MPPLRRTRAWSAVLASVFLVLLSFVSLARRRHPNHNHPGSLYRPVAYAPPTRTPSRALVVSTTSTSTTSDPDTDSTDWVHRLVAADDRLSAAVYKSESDSDSPASAYLSYIIDHYFDLPDVAIFMHSDRDHNGLLLDRDAAVARLRPQTVLDRGYVSLRCGVQEPGCAKYNWSTSAQNIDSDTNMDTSTQTDTDTDTAMDIAWKSLFPADPKPATTTTLAQQSGGSSAFAVSAAHMRRIPLPNYVFYRSWLRGESDGQRESERGSDSDSERESHHLDRATRARVWEQLWQWVFSGQATECPDERRCQCEVYGECRGEMEGYKL